MTLVTGLRRVFSRKEGCPRVYGSKLRGANAIVCSAPNMVRRGEIDARLPGPHREGGAADFFRATEGHRVLRLGLAQAAATLRESEVLALGRRTCVSGFRPCYCVRICLAQGIAGACLGAFHAEGPGVRCERPAMLYSHAIFVARRGRDRVVGGGGAGGRKDREHCKADRQPHSPASHRRKPPSTGWQDAGASSAAPPCVGAPRKRRSRGHYRL